MGNLFLSFSIAIGGALGLVTLSRVFDLDVYTSRIFSWAGLSEKED